MCRFFAFHGYLDEKAYDVLFLAISALSEASLHDRYAPFNDKSHGDGWGFSVFLKSGDLLLYKSVKPIWLDEGGRNRALAFLSKLKGEALSAIFHARRASPNTPKEVLDVHPFVVRFKDSGLFSFAHNGSFRVDVLGYSHLTRSDSYIYAKEVMRNSTPKDAPRTLHDTIKKGLVQTAMNVALSIHDFNTLTTIGVNFYLIDKTEYYDMYRLDFDGFHLFGSSTNMLALLEKLSGHWASFSFGKIGNGNAVICEEDCAFHKISDFSS